MPAGVRENNAFRIVSIVHQIIKYFKLTTVFSTSVAEAVALVAVTIALAMNTKNTQLAETPITTGP